MEAVITNSGAVKPSPDGSFGLRENTLSRIATWSFEVGMSVVVALLYQKELIFLFYVSATLTIPTRRPVTETEIGSAIRARKTSVNVNDWNTKQRPKYVEISFPS